jgi:beta-glucanase (GH16 family)
MKRILWASIILMVLALSFTGLALARPNDFCDRKPDHHSCTVTPTPVPTVAPTPAPTVAPTPTQGVTFFDDFTGTALSETWKGPKCSPFGAETAEWNAARTTVSNGTAKIQAVRMADGRWSSDLLSTWGRFEQRYGWFEARIKIPEGRGLWPAFWVLERDPINQCGNGPGELDVMEILANPEGSERSPEDVSLLFQVTHFHDGSQDMRWHDSGVNLSSMFHVYGVEWRESYVDYYLDDVRTHRIVVNSNTQLPGNFYLLLDLAVGGWPGPSDSTTPNPAVMEIDWVRVRP